MAKKNFKDNPALRFITPPDGADPDPPAAAPAAPMKPDPRYVETRSKRVQLLMQPALHAKLKRLAADRGQSLNDLVHTILSEKVE